MAKKGPRGGRVSSEGRLLKRKLRERMKGTIPEDATEGRRAEAETRAADRTAGE